MALEQSIRITAKDLMNLMGISLDMFDGFDKPMIQSGHSLVDFNILFSNEYTVNLTKFGNIKRPSRINRYQPGDIMMSHLYETYYMFIGKTSENKDLVLELGGDTSYAGYLRVGKINSWLPTGDDDEIHCDRRIWPPSMKRIVRRLSLMR